MTSTDTLLPCEHCGCRFGYHEAGCAALVDDIVSVAVTGFKADMERILEDYSTPPTPAAEEREAVAVAALINALKQVGGYPATISHLKSGKFSDSISARIAIAAIMDASAAEILAAEAEALGYATRLAVSLHATHFAVTAPEWQPLPDLIGVLTQIDNITTGIAEAAEANERARIAAWLRDMPILRDETSRRGVANAIERNEHGSCK